MINEKENYSLEQKKIVFTAIKSTLIFNKNEVREK